MTLSHRLNAVFKNSVLIRRQSDVVETDTNSTIWPVEVMNGFLIMPIEQAWMITSNEEIKESIKFAINALAQDKGGPSLYTDEYVIIRKDELVGVMTQEIEKLLKQNMAKIKRSLSGKGKKQNG